MSKTVSEFVPWSSQELNGWWAAYPDESDVDQVLQAQGDSPIFHRWLLEEVVPRRTARAQWLFRQWQAFQAFRKGPEGLVLLSGLPLVVTQPLALRRQVADKLAELLQPALGSVFEATVTLAPGPVPSTSLHQARPQAFEQARAGDWSLLVPHELTSVEGPCVWLLRLHWQSEAFAEKALEVLSRPALEWSSRHLREVYACLKAWGQSEGSSVEVLPLCPFWDAAPLSEMACLRTKTKALAKEYKNLEARFSRTGHIELIHDNSIVYRQLLPSQTADDLRSFWSALKSKPV